MGDLSTQLEHAATLARAGRPRQAEAIARSVLSEQPDLPEALALLAHALTEQGHGDDAVAPAREAARLQPDSASMQVTLSQALTAADRHEESVRHGRRAVALQPDVAWTHLALAKAMVVGELTHLLPEAVGTIRESLRLDPDSAFAHNLLGMAHQQLGDRAAARTSYRRALHLAPDQANAHNNLATLDFEERHLLRGADGLLSALSSDPTNPAYHENLRIVLAKIGAGFTALWVLTGTVLGLVLAFDAGSGARQATGAVWLVGSVALTGLAVRAMPHGVRRRPWRAPTLLERHEKLLVAIQVVPLLGVVAMAFAPTTVAVVAGCTIVAYVVVLTLLIVTLGGDDDE